MSSEQLPSSTMKSYWIYARRNKGRYQLDNPETSGKWLLFIHRSAIDRAWKKIKQATEEGLLGSASKVSTARPNPNASDSDNHVICVYTYDSDDYDDVSRIRSKLRTLGFTARIPYKTNKATIEGKYVVKGDTRISKYYE